MLGLWHLECGRNDLAASRVKSAKKNLITALDIFSELNKPVDMAKTYINLMVMYHFANDNKKAIENLHKANSILLPIGTLKPILPELFSYMEFFNEIIDKGKLTPELNTICNYLNEFQDNLGTYQSLLSPTTQVEESIIPRLIINAFGKTRLLIHGNEITLPEWTQQKTAREIFFYLVSESLPVSKDQIGLIFWPNSSMKQLNCQFKNAIYRLRKAIGKDAIIYDQFNRTYSFNKSLDYSYDVEDFLKVIKKAQSEESHSARILILQEVLDIYKHPYGQNLDGVWTEPIRRDLYTIFERAMIDLIELNLENGNFKDNITICEHILNIEPTQEKCWQLLMRTYAILHDRNGIIQSYKLCKKRLKHFLGISPSKDTEVLYKQLIQ
jgi:two-component SAPR family response regulator